MCCWRRSGPSSPASPRLGPPLATIPHIGTLSWGLTAAPVRHDPPLEGPDALRVADPVSRHVPALDGVPIAVVTAGASPFAQAGRATVDHLTEADTAVDRLHRPEHGVDGNGHGFDLRAQLRRCPAARARLAPNLARRRGLRGLDDHGVPPARDRAVGAPSSPGSPGGYRVIRTAIPR